MKVGKVERTVHGVVHPLVKLVDLSTEFLRVNVQLLPFAVGKLVVECDVEVSNDFRAFVVYDGLEFGVPKNRHREAAIVSKVFSRVWDWV